MQCWQPHRYKEYRKKPKVPRVYKYTRSCHVTRAHVSVPRGNGAVPSPGLGAVTRSSKNALIQKYALEELNWKS